MTTPLQLSNSSWIVKEQPNPDAVAHLMQNAGLTHLVASLLIQRGFEEQEDVLGFLNPALSAMHHSLLMKDMKEAVVRLHKPSKTRNASSFTAITMSTGPPPLPWSPATLKALEGKWKPTSHIATKKATASAGGRSVCF